MSIPSKFLTIFHNCIPMMFPFQNPYIFRFQSFETCIIHINIWNFDILDLCYLVEAPHITSMKVAIEFILWHHPLLQCIIFWYLPVILVSEHHVVRKLFVIYSYRSLATAAVCNHFLTFLVPFCENDIINPICFHELCLYFLWNNNTIIIFRLMQYRIFMFAFISGSGNSCWGKTSWSKLFRWWRGIHLALQFGGGVWKKTSSSESVSFSTGYFFLSFALFPLWGLFVLRMLWGSQLWLR